MSAEGHLQQLLWLLWQRERADCGGQLEGDGKEGSWSWEIDFVGVRGGGGESTEVAEVGEVAAPEEGEEVKSKGGQRSMST